jgi:hypothetical protein
MHVTSPEQTSRRSGDLRTQVPRQGLATRSVD